MAQAVPDQVLDCSGQTCPLPVINTNRAIHQMRAGQVLELIATDPATAVDIAAWTRRTGHRLLASEQHGEKYSFYIEKKREEEP